MSNKLVTILLVLSLVINVTGCATITGPSVSREEIEKAREELKVKALAYQIKQFQRLDNILNQLIRAVPKQDLKNQPQPSLGIRCLEVNRYLQRLYNLTTKKGVVVVVVRKMSPAYHVGIKPGDLLVSINKRKIDNLYNLNSVATTFKIGQPIQIQIIRGNETLNFETKIGEIPINCPLVLFDAPEVNAATDGRAIYVTYGLLNFAKSDDEIAAVLGHELAHAVRGHVVKAAGGQILIFLAALALGIAAESSSPGSGEGVVRGADLIGNIFTASYSRDLEREADYFGTKFVYFAGFDVDVCATVEERFAIEIPATMIQNYLSTHPSSPERVARIRKTIEELKVSQSATSETKQEGIIATE